MKVGNNKDVKFVRFASPQTAATVYTGGTLLDTVTPTDSIAGWPNGLPGSQFPANNGPTPVKYYVYAITADTVGLAANCRPFALKQYTILPLPAFTQTTPPVCSDSTTYKVTVNLPAGTFTVVLARSFGTIGNGPIPQDVIQTVSGASGSAMLTLAVADSAAAVIILDELTGCASLAPVVNPSFIPCTIQCVKPDAGRDSTIACVNNQLPTSFDLKDAASGQKWKIISPVPPGASISVTTPAGLVTGTIVAGTYNFVLQTQSDSLNCRDTVKITVTACPPIGQIALRPKAYLQGALFGVSLPDTLMRDDLRTQGYLPTTSPYPGMGMAGLTTANTSTAGVLGAASPAGKDAIVDWVFVELRSATDSVTVTG